MAVNFKKKIAGKKTKLATKTLDGEGPPLESPIFDQYVEANLYKIPLASISPDPNQPRKHFDKEKLAELTKSVKSIGILQPILVRKNDMDEGNSDFLIIAGERRFRAAQQAGLDVIPTIFMGGDPEEIALIENLQRDDLKPIEEAEAYARVMKSHGYSQNKLSSVVGKSRTTINEILTLNKLPEEVKIGCRTSDTPKNVLLEIAKQEDPEIAIALFNRVQNENFTVAKIRQLTRPKPERKTTSAEERALSKMRETKKLIPQIQRDGLNEEIRAQIWLEFNDLQRIMSEILS
ncbi:MAG: ParB/RepB/Spo0J family partition protein [Desulfobulbaceae bacterium]|nr:ParB/RepB/Spo0J family partition protein [Desulfobulbaceae bacterium]